MSAVNYDRVFGAPTVIDVAASSDSKSSDELLSNSSECRRVVNTTEVDKVLAAGRSKMATMAAASVAITSNVYYPYGLTCRQYANEVRRCGDTDRANNNNNNHTQKGDIQYERNLLLFPRLVYLQCKRKTRPQVDVNCMSVGVTWREYAADASFPLKMRIFEYLCWPYTVIGPLPVFKTRIYVENFNLHAFTDNDDRNIVYIALDGKHIDAKLEFVIAVGASPNQPSDTIAAAIAAPKRTPAQGDFVQSLIMTRYV